MMIDPPIDKLISMTECRYALTCAVSHRARTLISQEQDHLLDSGLKPVSLAAKEIYEGKVEIVKE